MRTKHKRIIMLLQFVFLGVVIFSISGVLGVVAVILGEVSLAEVAVYFEGLISGESLIIGGVFLKMNWKKIVEDFWDWIEGNDDNYIPEQKLRELKRLLRK